MINLIKKSIEEVANMSSRERMGLLCKLATKEHMGTIEFHESYQLEFIQTIRRENGEIDKVLKSWKENPELDPRITWTEQKPQRGTKEYFFNKEGKFSTESMKKSETVFKCNAINDKNAIRKFESWNNSPSHVTGMDQYYKA